MGYIQSAKRKRQAECGRFFNSGVAWKPHYVACVLYLRREPIVTCTLPSHIRSLCCPPKLAASVTTVLLLNSILSLVGCAVPNRAASMTVITVLCCRRSGLQVSME